MEKKIFVSHSSVDDKIVDNLLLRFKNYGLSNDFFFVDGNDLRTGDNIVRKIDKALEESEITLIVYTQAFLESQWTRSEKEISIKHLIEGKKKKIYVLKFEDLPIKDQFLDVQLSRDLYNNSLYEKNISLLAEELGQDLEIKKYSFPKIINDESLLDYLKYIFLNNRLSLEKIDSSRIGHYTKFFNGIVEIEGSFRKNASNGIFEDILGYVKNANSEIPLLISGHPGSGKSTFLSILFYYFWNKYSESLFEYTPIFVDVDIYNSYLEIEQARKAFVRDIEPIRDYIVENKKKPLIIVDGLDNYLKSAIDLNNTILEFLKVGFERKVIIGLSTTEHFDNRNVLQNVNSESVVKLQKIDKKTLDVKAFIETFSTIYNLSNFNIDSSKKINVFLNRLNQESLDFFLIRLFCENINLNEKQIRSISDLIRTYIKNKTDGQESTLRNCSEIAFNFYVNSETNNEFIKNHYNLWRLIHSHNLIRDYLIAYKITENLVQFKGKKGNFSEQDLEILKRVYPHSINNFCKEIINSTFNSQKEVLDSIQVLFDKVELTGKSHFCYLLGRLSHNSLKSKSKQFLNEKLKVAIQEINGINVFQDPKTMLFIRTIYISLAYLGDRKSSEEYLDKMIFDTEYDNINRGFHLEYYGDIAYDLSDSMSLTSHDDIFHPIARTFEKLYGRLNDSIKNGKMHTLFSIELYTLCSLIQHRHLKLDLDKTQIDLLTKLIKNVTEKPNFLLPENLVKYLTFFLEIVENPNLRSSFDLFLPVYSIKEKIRSGWISSERGRNVNGNIETIASHTYACVLLAKFYLQDKLPKEKKETYPFYNKSKIIEILLFHDLPEFRNGDIPDFSKTATVIEKESEAAQYISMLSSYNNFGNLSDIETNWKRYEGRIDSANKQYINYAIARDIDKIENLIQLLVYYFDKKQQINDFEEWFLDLVRRTTTEFGIEIVREICKTYDHQLCNFSKIASSIDF
ncbi:TIR domain-containing protein [Flagellimonas algicola]|uniref:HD domain-containing protein n=1 Tax=Flagellimonas algicola TaxID=2583815 RepID=A0ABY2WS26_9FLAO|nr:TIR domain-containing protein [Allomuricauda algicola]TMU57456.1 HD domain-containing protein [Allomuricauda algicola]